MSLDEGVIVKADYPLLGVLAREPMSGYGLSRWLENEGQFLGRKPSMTPIYRALADLADRGWIEATTVHSATGPDAKLYRLTSDGRAALVAWAHEPFTPADRPMAPDFIVRLNFAGQLGPDVALRLVETELDFRIAQRAAEEGPHQSSPQDPIPEISPAWLARLGFISHSRGWQSTSLYIGWLEALKAELAYILAQEHYPVAERPRPEGAIR
ncbi:hypothetical protein GCM10023171_22940 [Microbacterium panaciterrae]|uniref:Transcription regulator PadR N-terminal domain-containing protein n=1 Tax=Microbacterium panaciterrae TaxID=985759 RepID=A0ABP8PIE8_9MICO